MTERAPVSWIRSLDNGEIVSHSAVTMGVLLPRIVAAEIVTGAVDPLLTNFRPNRFG